MAKKITSVEVYFMVKELQLLIDSKIDKIYDDEEGTIVFCFHRTDMGKKFLIIKEECLYLSNDKPMAQEMPSDTCMQFRKYLTDSRVRKIHQVESERIIEFEISTKDFNYALVIELFGGGNVLLLKDEIIIATKLTKVFTQRKIAIREKYVYPLQKYNFISITKESLQDLLNTSEKQNIVKTLAMELSLGGLYAEELLALTDIDKNTPTKDTDVEKVYSALKTLLSSKIKPNKIRDFVVPIELKTIIEDDAEKIEYDTFSKAIEQNADLTSESKVKKIATETFEKKIDKLQLIINTQKKQIDRMQKESEDNKNKAELIYKNYECVEEELKRAKEPKIKLNLD